MPISYAPKENILVRLHQDPEFDNQVRVTLPRLAFEITAYNYDASRVNNRNSKITYGSTGVFSPVPYNLSMSLYLLTKGTQDALSVVEQILPKFMPEFIMSINTIPDLNIIQDIPIILNSVTSSQDYEGDFKKTQLSTHTFDFTLKLNLYHNPGVASRITRVDADINTKDHHAHYTATGDISTETVTSSIWDPS